MLDQTLLFYHIYYIVAISVHYLFDYLIGSNFFNFKFLALFLIYLLPIRSYFIYLNIKKMSILVKVSSDKNKKKKCELIFKSFGSTYYPDCSLCKLKSTY